MGFIKHRFPPRECTHTHVGIYTPIYIVLYMREAAINSNHTI